QIKDEVVAVRGNQCGGWWKYVIPGFGCVEWGKYIRRLRDIGFDGVLSIEHEDGSFTPEEGLEKGLQFLRLYA
ncbi:sugar phosphate isomerase/epimerase, partial [bacterium]|nr:sugar phosphate isomerase/epimerase [bacterium]